MAAEKQFENQVKDWLKSQGCWLVKYWGGGAYTKAGVPDLLVCCGGYFIAIELKAPTGKPSQLQLWTIDQIRKAGGFAIVLYPDKFYMLKDLVMDLKRGEDVEFWHKHQTFFDKE